MAFKARTTNRSRKSAAQIAAAKKNLEKARAARSRAAKGKTTTTSSGSKNSGGLIFEKDTTGWGSKSKVYDVLVKNKSGKAIARIKASGYKVGGELRYSVQFAGKRDPSKYNVTLDEVKKMVSSKPTTRRRRRRRRTTTAKK